MVEPSLHPLFFSDVSLFPRSLSFTPLNSSAVCSVIDIDTYSGNQVLSLQNLQGFLQANRTCIRHGER